MPQFNVVRSASTAVFSSIESLEPRRLLSGGPRVVYATIRDGAETYGFLGEIQVHFDRPVKAIGTSDFRLSPAGSPGTSLGSPSWHFDRDATEVAMTFNGELAPGNYTLTLFSGDGKFEGVDGADMDGELPASGELPSGDQQAGGDFVLHFSVVPFSTRIAPKQLKAYPLSGSAIEVQWTSDVRNNYHLEIERAEGAGQFVKLADVRDSEDPTNHYIDESAVAGVTYRYRMRAFDFKDDVAGYSDYSNVATSDVLPPSLSLPVAQLSSVTGARPDWLTNVGGQVYFTWSNDPSPTDWAATNSLELWTTDGTAAGTTRVFAGPARGLINVSGTLFFSGYDSQAGYELWKTDGTAAGTVRVADIVPGTLSSSPRPLGVLGSSLLFGIPITGNAYELWKSDGTNTVRVSTTPLYLDAAPDSAESARRLFTVAGAYAYFRGATPGGADAATLWRTDGTGAGTVQVAGIEAPEWLTSYGGNLLFAARSDTTNTEQRALWRLNAGVLSASILGRPNTALSDLTVIDGVAYFSGDTSAGPQMWRSDGTVSGTFMFARVNFIGPSVQYAITDVGSSVFFMQSDIGPHAPLNTLFRTDGTAAGTAVIRDYVGLPGDTPLFYLGAGDRFVYSDGTYLWQSDGTRAGTTRVDDIGIESHRGSGEYGFAGAPAVAVGDRVFYSAARGDGSRELRVASLTPPAAPSGVTAGDGGAPANVLAVAAAAGVTVSWQDNAGNEAGYVVDRFRTGAAIPEETFFSPPNASSLLDPSAASTDGFTYRVRSYNAGGYSAAATTAPPQIPYKGSPFAVGSTPVTIQAEDYDLGGEGIAYHDTTSGNVGGVYRNENVDIKLISGTSNQYRLSDAAVGEWVEYTIDAQQAGNYDLELRLSNTDPNAKVHVEIDGVNVTGALAVPDTNNFSTFASVKKGGIAIGQGTHVLRLVFDVAASTGSVAGVDWLKLSATPVTPPPGSTVTLDNTIAAYVRDGASATTNFGNDAQLIVKLSNTTGNKREGYLKFDVSALPSDPAAITNVKLRLNGKLSASGASPIIGVFGASNTSWGETSINWNTKPATSGSALATKTISGTAAAWYEWDITNYVKTARQNGQQFVTLVLRATNTTDPQAVFNSDDAASNGPQLVATTSGPVTPPAQALVVTPDAINVPEASKMGFSVKLSSQPASDVTVTISKQGGGDADLTSDKTTLTFTPANWNVAQSVFISAAADADTTNGQATFAVTSSGLTTINVTATEQDDDTPTPPPGGTITTDTASYVRGGTSAGQNFGTASDLIVKKANSADSTREIYLKFDFSGPSAPSTINTAKLRLNARLSDTSNASLVTQVFSATDASWTESGLTWNNKPASDTTVRGSFTVTGTTAQWYEIDLTSFLKAELAAGRKVVTLVLKNTTASNAQTVISSDETANGPQLVVT